MKPKTATIILYEPPPEQGVWLPPAEACKYFRNGRGIALKTLMTKLYAGKLGRYAKWSPQGWLILISNDMLNKENKTA